MLGKLWECVGQRSAELLQALSSNFAWKCEHGLGKRVSHLTPTRSAVPQHQCAFERSFHPECLGAILLQRTRWIFTNKCAFSDATTQQRRWLQFLTAGRAIS
jgi:hypothetical protein